MSRAASEFSPTKQLVTPSHEAFIYVMFVNNQVRWGAAFEHYKKKADWSANLPKQVKKSTNERGERIKAVDPFYDAKFTCSDSGQNRFGTFSQEGIDLYKQMTAEIKEDRRGENRAEEIMELEKMVLNAIRKDHKVSGDGGAKRKTKNAGDGACKKRHPAEEVEDLVDEDEDMDQTEILDLTDIDGPHYAAMAVHHAEQIAANGNATHV